MKTPLRTPSLHIPASLIAVLLHASATAGPTVEVWLDLSEPPPGLQADASGATERIARLRAQQDDIAARLPVLGAVELARVQRVGNSIAVRVDADRISDLQTLPGVKRVRPARTLHPPKPMP
ncbi:hypothetical protein [Variovorax sp. YR752]|uniref:hypothetical protein n=1 Tax=Variovorax sp. YR752 TaxID=1884383 RepID=UPI003137B748